MSRKGKEYLKDVFRQGALPTESNFALLIDSMFNLEDDEFERLIDGPLQLHLTPKQDQGELDGGSVLEFFNHEVGRGNESAWKFSVTEKKDDDEGGDLIISDRSGRKLLRFTQDGKIILSTDELKLNGTLARAGDKGTFKSTDKDGESLKAPKADGEWHPIVANVKPCQMYQVVAGVGYPKGDDYALAHAVASLVPRTRTFWDFMPSFTPRNAKIQITQSHSSRLNCKLDFKWTDQGDGTFNLEVRTRKDFGGKATIQCNVTKMWFDPEMGANISDAKS